MLSRSRASGSLSKIEISHVEVWITELVTEIRDPDDPAKVLTQGLLAHHRDPGSCCPGRHSRMSRYETVKAMQRMLGHASAAMTLDVHADLFDNDLDVVANALDAARRRAAAGQLSGPKSMWP
ncbi:hypothetical protein ACWDUM_17800 [Rhodococcus sp. NPDC003322]